MEEILAMTPETRLDVSREEPPKTFSEISSLPKVKHRDLKGGIIETTPEQVAGWKAKGKIGFFEQWSREDKTEMIPFNPEGAVKKVALWNAVKRLQDPRYAQEQLGRSIRPFLGPYSEAMTGKLVAELNFEDKERQNAKDFETVNKFILGSEEERVRGYTIGGMVMQGVTALPAFMLEFMATGPVASIGKTAVKKTALGISKNLVKSKLAKGATRLAGGVAGAGVRTAVGLPHRVTKGLAERQIESSLELTDKGIELLKDAREKPHISAMKAFGDVWIESFSEVTGPALRAGTKAIVPVPMKNALVKIYKKIKPNASVEKLFTKSGFDGFLEEMGEERVGGFLRALTGVEDFGADDPSSAMDRIVSSIPSGEELLVEALVLGVPGTLRMSLSQITNQIRRRKEETKAVEPELNDLTDEQIEEIVTEDATAEPEDITAAEEKIAEGQAPAEAFEEVLGDKVPQGTKDALVEQFIGPEELPEEEAGISFDPAALEAEAAKIEQDPEQAGEFEAGELNAVRGALSTGTEGVQIPEAMVMREARLLREQAIDRQVPSAIEEFVINTGGVKPFKEGAEKEEYSKVPQRFRKAKGQPLDQMVDNAIEAGVVPAGTTADDLLNMLADIGDKPKRPLISEFLEEAEEVARFRREAFVRVMPGIKGEIRRQTGQFKGEATINELTALNAVMQAQARAAVKAKKMTKDEIEAAQNKAIRAIDNSGISAHDKAKFIKTIKNINSREKLIGAMPVIRARIRRLIQASDRRAILSQIDKEMKSAKVKKQSGRPVGKFTADFQAILDTMREAIGLSSDEAIETIQRNLVRYENAIMPDDVVVENQILSMMGGLKDRSNAELSAALQIIQSTKEEGALAREAFNLDRRERVQAWRDTAKAEITGGKGVSPGAATFGIKDKSETSPVKSAIVTFGRNLVHGWNDILNVLSSKSRKPAGQSFIEQAFEVFNETRGEEEGIGNFNVKLRAMIERAYGVSKEAEVLDIVRGWNEQIVIGTFTNATRSDEFPDGVTAPLVMTKAQVRKKWMEMQDPTLSETFTNENGMAYTPEIIEAINKQMTDQDKSFVREHLQFYREYYERINEVYRELYGVDLPRNEFYSPISRTDIEGKEGGLGEFMQEVNRRISLTSGSMKNRVKSMKPLRMTSDVSVMEQHVFEMERFVNWGHKIRDINAVLNDAAVKDAIRQEYGSDMLGVMKRFMDDFTRGGMDPSKREGMLDDWRIRITHVKLAVRPSIFVKQTISQIAFLENLTISEFVSGTTDFWKAPLKNFRILQKAGFLRFRGKNFERDLKAAVSSDPYKAVRKRDTWVNRLMFNVQLGDQLAIVSGGWGVYKKALREGKSEAEALEAFSRAANSAQQSADLAEQSNFQRGSSLHKAFTMFATTPIQYLRKEIGAVRNFAKGRMSAKDAAKRIIIYHFILPMLFQWVSDFGKVKPKEQLRAAIFGNLNGLFILKDFLDNVLRTGLDMATYANKLPIMSTPYDDLKKAVFSVSLDDIKTEDVMEAVYGLLGIAGFLTKVPLKEVARMVASLEKIYDGEYRKGIGGALGWTEHSLKTTDERKGPFQ